MKPMLAHLYDGRDIPGIFYVQPKLNGIRALYQNGGFWSRDEVKWRPEVVLHITEELRQVVPSKWILDGEFYNHGWSLQQINSAIGVKRLYPTLNTHAISFNVFDAISERPFIDRFSDLIYVVRDLKHTHLVPTYPCDSPDCATELFNRYKRFRYEGIMYRLDPHSYAIGKRVSFLLKRKAWHDEEFQIIGIEPGLGKYSGSLGALVCITPNGKEFRVGTGFDDGTRLLFNLTPPVGSLAKVQFIGYSDEGIPLNTSFQGLVDE
jgi:DNA ligase 1